MFSIGEFSRITGLTIKALRFYHEQQVLVPSYIDDQTGYRYYSENKVETARIIGSLKSLGFSISEIANILRDFDDESDILEHLQRQKESSDRQCREFRDRSRAIQKIISNEEDAKMAMKQSGFDVQEKQLDSILIASIKMKGPYQDCGKGFAKIGKRYGRHICGKAFLLHHDDHFRENDATFEACFPIKSGAPKDSIDVRELPGGNCVSLLHQGPYDEIGRSYEKILTFAKEKGLKIELPTREVYLKGPGMIFRGNPKKYLTEIQMMILESQE